MKRRLESLVVQNLSVLSPKNFIQTCRLPEFHVYCDGKLSEEMYEERVKRHFERSLIQFKIPGMTWREFYTRLALLIDYLPAYSDYTDPLIRDQKLMELKILFAIKKKFNVRDYNTIGVLVGKNTDVSYEILLLLEKARVFPIYFINRAADAHESVYTYGTNLASVAAINGNLRAVLWFKKYTFLPSRKAYEIAEYRGHYEVVEWARMNGYF